jgi:glyoxylase-like metal-dependent hydrolase (beta-lactamase superfamily II)
LNVVAGLLFPAAALLSLPGCVPVGRGADGGPGRGDPGEGGGGDDGGNGCGGGTFRPGALEIHHLELGQADATLVVGPTGRSLLVDVGEPVHDEARGAEKVGRYVAAVLGCRRIDQVLLTHFHVDHVGLPGRGGLWHLVHRQGFEVGKTLHRDAAAFLGQTSATVRTWRAHLAGEGRARLRPTPAREGADQVDLGPGVTFRIVAADGAGLLKAGDFSRDPTPPNENDYSVAGLLRFGRFDYFIGGDLSGTSTAGAPGGYSYHDVEHAVAPRVGDVDVLRVNHHGSDHSSGAAFLAQLDPEVSIVSVGDDNPYGHPHAGAVRRLLATGDLYLTQRGDRRVDVGPAVVGGDVVVRTDGRSYEIRAGGGVRRHEAVDPLRADGDGDGWLAGADPDDGDPEIAPAPRGACDARYQSCP